MPTAPPTRGLFAADHLSSESERTVEMLRALFSAAAFLIGAAGVLGWRFDIPLLRQFHHDLPAIRPMSALCLTLLAGALRFGTTRPLLGRALSIATTLIAAFSLVGESGGIEAHLRQAIVNKSLTLNAEPSLLERSQETPFPAAFGFLVLSLVYLAANIPRMVLAAQTVALAAMFVTVVPLLSGLLRIESEATHILPSTPSLQACLGVVLLSAGIVLLGPQRGVIGLLSANTAASRAARGLIAPALGLPILLGGLFVYARERGLIAIRPRPYPPLWSPCPRRSVAPYSGLHARVRESSSKAAEARAHFAPHSMTRR